MSFAIFYNDKNAIINYKTRTSKSLKIDIFPKWLTHGFRQKMAIFSKGLTQGFGPKIIIFPSVFLSAIKARKMSFMIFYNEKTPFYAIKTRSSKSRKMAIFPKGLTHGFGPKMAIFPKFFF